MSESKPQWTQGDWRLADTSIVTDEHCIAVLEDDGDYAVESSEEMTANGHLMATAKDLYEALRPLAATRIDPDTASVIEAAIIEWTGDGELAAHICKLLTDGASEARRASSKARGEEAPE